MNEIDADELLGSKCRVAKMISDQKIIKRFFNLYKNFFFRRNLQVKTLNVNLYLTIEEEKISEVRFGDVSEVNFRSPGNQLVQEQNNYGGLNHGE